jgi:hypothetical protein
MRTLPESASPNPTTSTVQRQLGITFDLIRLRGMNETDRAKALAHLANLLMQSGGVVAKESGNDKC